MKMSNIFSLAAAALFNSGSVSSKRESRSQAGLPYNISSQRKPVRASAVVQYNVVPHVTREGKTVISKEKGGKPCTVMVHHAVDRRGLKRAMSLVERAKRGRYVGPFNAPDKVAR